MNQKKKFKKEWNAPWLLLENYYNNQRLILNDFQILKIIYIWNFLQRFPEILTYKWLRVKL